MEPKRTGREFVVYHARIESRHPPVLAYRAGTLGRVGHSAGGEPRAYLTDEEVEFVVNGPGTDVVWTTVPPGTPIPVGDDDYGSGPMVRVRFEGGAEVEVDDVKVRVRSEGSLEIVQGEDALPYPIEELQQADSVSWASADSTDPQPHQPG